MTVSRRLRFEILRRDGHTCRYCGAAAPDVALTVDHVIPIALGGGDDPTNLVTACADCNAGKSSVAPDAPMVADVDAAALLFAKALERVTEVRRIELEGQGYLREDFVAAWREWYSIDAAGTKHTIADTEAGRLPSDWEGSFDRFMAQGLDLYDMKRFIAETMKYRPDNFFRFFCKKCWDEISYRQERARRLIEDGRV